MSDRHVMVASLFENVLGFGYITTLGRQYWMAALLSKGLIRTVRDPRAPVHGNGYGQWEFKYDDLVELDRAASWEQLREVCSAARAIMVLDQRNRRGWTNADLEQILSEVMPP